MGHRINPPVGGWPVLLRITLTPSAAEAFPVSDLAPINNFSTFEKRLKKVITRVYIDTSVIGGCIDQEFKEWSVNLFEEFKNGKKIAVITDITLDELVLAPKKVQNIPVQIPDKYLKIVESNSETEELARQYILRKAVSEKFSPTTNTNGIIQKLSDGSGNAAMVFAFAPAPHLKRAGSPYCRAVIANAL